MNEKKTIKLKEVMGYARGQLIGNYGIAIWVAVLPVLIEALITAFGPSASNTGSLLIGVLISTVADLLVGVLILGQAKVFLHLSRGDKMATMADFFGAVKENVDKAILIQLPFTLVSLLCLVPSIFIELGIITIPQESIMVYNIIEPLAQIVVTLATKAFLGFCFYILADHPEYDVKTVFVTSIEMLEGYRIKYLLIYVVNLPLMVLSVFACFVGVFWFQAYLSTVFVNYYLLIKGEKPWSVENEKTSY